MVSPQPIYNLSSYFVLIVDKGGEIHKDSKIGEQTNEMTL